MGSLGLWGTLSRRMIHATGSLCQSQHKIGLVINEQVTLKHVTDVYADHLVEQITNLVPGVTLFKQEQGESMQAALDRLDSLNVPFTLCLDECLATRAIVGLRMRNTKICEEIHSSHLAEKVVLYLAHLPLSLREPQ